MRFIILTVKVHKSAALGHMLYSTTFNYLEKVAAHIYPSKINVDVNSENYDYILAIQILRTSYEVEKRLEKLPSEFYILM